MSRYAQAIWNSEAASAGVMDAYNDLLDNIIHFELLGGGKIKWMSKVFLKVRANPGVGFVFSLLRLLVKSVGINVTIIKGKPTFVSQTLGTHRGAHGALGTHA